MDCNDRNIIVTGAGGGIGRALAQRFIQENARSVSCVDLHEDAVQKTSKELGAKAHAYQLDVTDEAALQELVERIENQHGPVSVFCSNAGIAVPGGIETTNAELDASWQVNLLAHLYAARAMIPKMLERQEGYLINTASAAGLLTQIGSLSYAITKHAAVSLAESLAITYGDKGIRVSVLCPQAVRTAMTAGSENGGVAGVDGMLEPEAVAQEVIRVMGTEEFLILPHPEVLTYMRRKTDDYDRWIGGMRRLRDRYLDNQA
ncbi:MAG: SDR family oxidoreductase [Gammaproteobacteria bacterium]